MANKKYFYNVAFYSFTPIEELKHVWYCRMLWNPRCENH